MLADMGRETVYGLGIGGMSHQSCMSLRIGTNNIVGGSISSQSHSPFHDNCHVIRLLNYVSLFYQNTF